MYFSCVGMKCIIVQIQTIKGNTEKYTAHWHYTGCAMFFRLLCFHLSAIQ
jgi:hypothetical protein